VIEIVGTLLVIAVVVALGVAADRKFHILPRREQLKAAGGPPRTTAPPAFQAGEAPISALAPNPSALARLRVPPRCGIDGDAMVADQDDHVRYGGRELLVLRFRCARCGATRSIYCQTDRLQQPI
jgi:hypothetical protein